MTAKEYAESMSTLEDRYNELLKIELRGEEYDPHSPVGREASQRAFGQLKKETGLIGLTFTDMAGMGHQAKVRFAIEEGKPVPPEVLADYPHLLRGNPMAPTKEVLKLEVRIPLELLWKDEPNYLAQLTHEVREHGITEPITIRVRKDGSKIVWDGLHRLAVAQRLGIEEIPVIYIPMPTA